ncbi:hypothetical protein [Paucidesulfovibrio longus]|uniref:hypothetical protein n=1 Tax=Paucidesulfovibrio longus TaxID=889 RepID=UPI00138B0E59|nr:hypothetical protein [Paucidesulfovibrio longus]
MIPPTLLIVPPRLLVNLRPRQKLLSSLVDQRIVLITEQLSLLGLGHERRFQFPGSGDVVHRLGHPFPVM